MHYPVPNESIEKALSLVVDSGNYPMLLHCNKGKVCDSALLPVSSRTAADCARPFL